MEVVAVQGFAAPPVEPGEKLSLVRLGSRADYRSFRRDARAELARRRRFEAQLRAGGDSGELAATCWLCSAPVAFGLQDITTHGWREGLRCPRCWFGNRARAALHLCFELLQPSPDDAIYLTEQDSLAYRWCDANFRRIIGSEYLGEAIPFGLCDAWGIRNEDLQALTLAPESRDFVFCFDVLEHVPDPLAAMAECFRVLRDDGVLLLTVPLDPRAQRNVQRARRDPRSGGVRHLEEPELHFDPREPRGSLVFHTFGWEVLEQLRRVGFAEVCAYLYWSAHFAYLGADQFVLVARKEPAEGRGGSDADRGLAEARLRRGYEKQVRRLRVELRRVAETAPSPLPPAAAGGGLQTPEEVQTRRELARLRSRLARSFANHAELIQQLTAELRRRQELADAQLAASRAQLASIHGSRMWQLWTRYHRVRHGFLHPVAAAGHWWRKLLGGRKPRARGGS